MLRRVAALTAVLALAPVAPAFGDALLRVGVDRPRVDVPALEALGLDVTHEARNGHVDVLATPADRRRLTAAGFPFTVRIADVAAAARTARAADARAVAASGRSALPSGRESYRTYAEHLAALDEVVAAHPGLARRVVLPERSVEGREIVGVEIAKDVGRQDDGRPVFVVVGDHHAREWPSAEVATEFALDLVRGAATDARIGALLDRVRVYVIPVLNPDGFVASRDVGGAAADRRKSCAVTSPSDASVPCASRPTSSGVDLNRNYGAYWGGNGASPDAASDTYRGPGPWSEPETRAFHELTQHLQVTGVQSLHNYAGLVLRPPGFAALGLAPDEPRLKALGDAMASATGYTSQYGYELYEVTGATEDWNYVAQGAFGYTIELAGETFQGPYAQAVVDQYLGAPGTPQAGKGVREALLLAAEEAADPADHGVLEGTATAGATLRLRKAFTTTTSPVCAVQAPSGDCLSSGAALALDDGLDTTTVVGAGGHFTWHVAPSTRPFEAKAGRTEAWTLSCEAGGRVLRTQAVRIVRGQRLTVSPCPVGPPSVAVGRRTLRAALREGVRVRVRCAVACRTQVTLAVGGHAAGSRTVTLRAGRRTVLRVAVTGVTARAALRRAQRPRVDVRVAVTQPGGPSGRLTRHLRLSR